MYCIQCSIVLVACSTKKYIQYSQCMYFTDDLFKLILLHEHVTTFSLGKRWTQQNHPQPREPHTGYPGRSTLRTGVGVVGQRSFVLANFTHRSKCPNQHTHRQTPLKIYTQTTEEHTLTYKQLINHIHIYTYYIQIFQCRHRY